MGIASDLADIKEVSDTIVANKVSKFCYTDTAYEDNDANGVNAYDINNEQNIPVGTPSVMKVNETVVTKGWRARASSITRMFMNHMLGRLSYNVNKLTDMFQSILIDLSASLGTANGIATLDSNAVLTESQLPRSNVAEQNSVKPFTAGGAYDYFLSSSSAKKWLSRVFGDRLCLLWRKCTGVTVGTYTQIVNILVYKNHYVLATNKEVHLSNDGITWSEATFTTTGYLRNIIIFNDLLLVITTEDVWWTEDGQNWTQSTGTTTESRQINNFFNTEDILIICKYTDGAFWTEDGKSFTQVTGLLEGAYNGNISYGNGRFVLCTQESGKGVYWSDDGKDWTLGSGYNNDVNIIANYANGIWVMGATNSVYWSNDGKSWTQGSGVTTTAQTPVYSEKYHLWVSSGGTGGIYWSEDGKSWTKAYDSEDYRSTGDVKEVGGILYLTTTSGTNTVWSNSGKYWSPLPNTIKQMYTIKYANGLWVATSEYSPDDPSNTSGLYVSRNGISFTRIHGIKQYSHYYCKFPTFVKELERWYAVDGSSLLYSDVEQLLEDGYFSSN